MQEGKQDAEARGRVAVDNGLVIHWDLFCKHKHQPPASQSPCSHFTSETFLSSASACFLMHAANRTISHDLREWNSTVPQLSLALFRMLELQHCPEKAETEEQPHEWLEQINSRSDHRESYPFTSRAWKVKVARATMPTTCQEDVPQKGERKKYSENIALVTHSSSYIFQPQQ